MNDAPDIRIPVGDARPLTKSEKCSIAGRKGAAVTNARYPHMKRKWGQMGFDAMCESLQLNRAQGRKVLIFLQNPDKKVGAPCPHSWKDLVSLKAWVDSMEV